MIGEEEIRHCPECGLTLYQDVSQCPRCLAQLKPITMETPMMERVYVPEITEKPPKEGKDVRKFVSIIIILIIVAILIIALSYHFLIPRLELKVITEYRESSGLAINVDSKLKNEGTLSIQNFYMNITVLNSSLGMVARGEYNLSDLEAHSSYKFDNIYFYGDQYDKYMILIQINFESDGKDYSKIFDHTVDENMRIKYEDSIFSWGG